jgi:pilus assembly protein Flp/PilA
LQRLAKPPFLNERLNDCESDEDESSPTFGAAQWLTTKGPTLRQEQIPMFRSLASFIEDNSGATAIEYALIASLIAVAIIVSITVLGSQLQNTFNEVSSNLK